MTGPDNGRSPGVTSPGSMQISTSHGAALTPQSTSDLGVVEVDGCIATPVEAARVRGTTVALVDDVEVVASDVIERRGIGYGTAAPRALPALAADLDPGPQ